MYIYIKLFSQNRLLTFFLFYEKTIMNFFNIGLNFTLETFMLCKSMGTEGSGLEAVNFDIPLKTMYFFSFSTMSLRDALISGKISKQQSAFVRVLRCKTKVLLMELYIFSINSKSP